MERITLNLIAQASQALANLQARSGMNRTDLVNRALTVYDFIDAELAAGRAIVIRDRDGKDQLVKIL